jgi:hypothetical protein
MADMLIPIMMAAGARISGGYLATDERAAKEFEVDRLLGLAKRKAKNPERFDTNPPFFWRSEVSNDRVDSYFTRMHASTLKAFARDAKVGSDTRGVAFQYSHEWRKLGLGHSLDGQFEELGDNDATGVKEANQRTLVDFYTVPGMRLNAEMGTDDLIVGIETGVLEDVSVGFYAGSVKCGICGGDMYQGFFGGYYGKKCNHYPGMVYEDPYVDDKGNATGGKVLATAWIHDGRLSEVSQVYDGACPGAGHLKAQIFAAEGKEDARTIRALEQHYRMKLPGGALMVPVGDRGWQLAVAGRAEGAGMDPRKRLDGETDEQYAARMAALGPEGGDPAGAAGAVVVRDQPAEPPAQVIVRAAGEPAGGEGAGSDDDADGTRAILRELREKWLPEGIELTGDVRTTVDGLCQYVKDTRAKAAMGDRYFADMVEEACKEGVRALSDAFDRAKMEPELKRMTLDGVLAFRDSWKAAGDKRFATGRSVEDQGDDGPKNPAGERGKNAGKEELGDEFFQA